MDNTGERHILNEDIKDEAEYYNHLMHIATYQYALNFVQNKHVLDYGCGAGYGSLILSKIAKSVVGADVSLEAVDFAINNYKESNLLFTTISELSASKFDVITSFQVVEHVLDAQEFMLELKSLLKPDGFLLISTPDKKYRLYNFIQRPWNIYHIKEYTGRSLRVLLCKHFKKVEIIKIGSKSDFVKKEISRTKKQRLITLPCTLIIYPDFLRVYLLIFQVKVYKSLKKYMKKKVPANADTNLNIDLQTRYTVADIEFNNNLELSTDLFAICN